VVRYNLGKLSELEVRQQYQIKISTSFTAMENVIDNKDVNRTEENIKENLQLK
jgi:hypothetical protein